MKIAIVGGTESNALAPFDDKSWQIWIIGNQAQAYNGKRVSKIFEIHNDLSNRPPNYAQWLVDFNIPMIVGEEFPVKADHVQVFDFEASRKMMDYGGKLNLTSTPAYMISHALSEYGDEVEEIGMWGVDMAVDDTEYFYEQPCVKEWMGYARAKGVKITLPEGCPIGAPKYNEGITGNKPKGIEPFTEDEFGKLAKMHNDSIAKLNQEIQERNNLIQAHGGAAQAYERMASTARAVAAGQDIGTLSQTVRVL